jgi:glycerol-3-phosphate acyltransferase PlsY
MLAVVAGHIWPIQLRFHGGKGVATGLGALLVLQPALSFGVVVLFLPFYGLLRNFVLAGMAAFTVLPLAAFLLGEPLTLVFGVSALAVVILIAHRRNIPDEIAKLSAARRPKESGRGLSDHSA